MSCGHTWCDVDQDRHGDEDEHWFSSYTPASLSGEYRKPLTVGAGLSHDVSDADRGTRIYVHIDGAQTGLA